MIKKITLCQENHLCDLFREGLKALSLSKDEAGEIIKAGTKTQKQFKPILQQLPRVDERFGPPIQEFEFTIPSDYNHESQLDIFGKKTKPLSTTDHFNDDLTSNNFAKATNKLEPGKTYKVKIFPILIKVTSEDCISFLAKQNAILVGGQGVTLLQSEMPDVFPIGKHTVSFDQKDALFADAGGLLKVPCVFRHLSGSWKFRLGYFKGSWNINDCLLCFCDLQELVLHLGF